MRKIFVGLEKEEMIILGRQGEKNVAVVIWDISQWVKDYGEGSVTLLYTLEGAENLPYPCQVTVNDGQVEWLITPTELMLGSRGKCQLIYSVGNRLVTKSPIYRTRVQSSLGEKSCKPPESFTGWVDDVLKAGALAEQAAIQAEEAIEQVGEAAKSVLNQIGQASSQAMQEMEEKSEQIGKTIESSLNQITQAESRAVQTVEDTAKMTMEQLEEMAKLIPSVTETDNGKIMTVMDGKWTALEPGITDWEKVQLIVRAGLARQYFPVGYEFVTYDSTEDTNIVWVVRGYDTIQAADESLSHTMILETKYAYSDKNGAYVSLDFDSEELLYFCENQLEAGTYHFTLLDGYEETYGGGKTYSFTLTQPVPAGGVILFPWTATTQASETDIVTYASVSSKSAIETTQVTEGANGTLLGTADGNTPGMNHSHRIHYGSNNYAQSAIRQWLNSPEAAGEVWEAQTKFDRPPKWENTQAGFLAGLPEDFLSVIQTAIVQCQTNSIFEVDSLDGTVYTIGQTYNLEDRFFILSRVEVDGTYENTQYQDGMQLDFYDGLSSSERIPYGPNGSAYTKRLRTAANTDASLTVIVNTSGNISNTSARLRTVVFPACIIA